LRAMAKRSMSLAMAASLKPTPQLKQLILNPFRLFAFSPSAFHRLSDKHRKTKARMDGILRCCAKSHPSKKDSSTLPKACV